MKKSLILSLLKQFMQDTSAELKLSTFQKFYVLITVESLCYVSLCSYMVFRVCNVTVYMHRVEQKCVFFFLEIATKNVMNSLFYF